MQGSLVADWDNTDLAQCACLWGQLKNAGGDYKWSKVWVFLIPLSIIHEGGPLVLLFLIL